MSDGIELVYFKSEDMRVKDPNARLQAMILKLKGDQALILSHRADFALWEVTYTMLTEQTKLLLLDQIRRALSACAGGSVYGLTRELECFLPDMVMKQGLPPPPPPATGIMGLTIATRRKKAKDPKTSKEDLAILVNDKDTMLRNSLLTNKSFPTDIVIDLAHKCMASISSDDDDSWRSAHSLELIAKKEALPADLLEEIVTIKSESLLSHVRITALKNPSFPIERFAKLSVSKFRQVREAVACCTRTPEELLMKLQKDKDEGIRDSVERTLRKIKEDQHGNYPRSIFNPHG